MFKCVFFWNIRFNLGCDQTNSKMLTQHKITFERIRVKVSWLRLDFESFHEMQNQASGKKIQLK